MTRWFFLFLLAITLVLSFRLFTFSSAPIVATSCEEVSITSKLSGIWNLNRIDNFSGFSPYLKSENIKDYSLIINSTFPFLLSNSQILIVTICGEEMSISYNYFRNWQQYSFSLLENKKFKTNIDAHEGSAIYQNDFLTMEIDSKNIDFKQEIYLDGGELIREIEFFNSSTGKIKFIYRKSDQT